MTPTPLELLAVASALVAFSGLPGLLLPRVGARGQRIATCAARPGMHRRGRAAAGALAGGPRRRDSPGRCPAGA